MAERSDKHPQWVIDLFFPTGPVEHDLQVLSFFVCFVFCMLRAKILCWINWRDHSFPRQRTLWWVFNSCCVDRRPLQSSRAGHRQKGPPWTLSADSAPVSVAISGVGREMTVSINPAEGEADGVQRVNGHTPYRQAHSASYRTDSRMHISRDCPGLNVHSHYRRGRFWTQTYQDFHPGFSGILALKEMAFFLQMCFVQQVEEIKIKIIKIKIYKTFFYFFYHYAPN